MGGYHSHLGGISLTFLVVDKIVDEFSVGGISLTLGGDITHTWGGYHSQMCLETPYFHTLSPHLNCI
jgi:hypothetical protein